MKLAATIVAAIIAEATAVRNQKVEEPKNGKKPDPRAEAIQAVFAGKEPFGCHTQQAAQLVEAMTGIKISVTKNNRIPQFHVVVPVDNAVDGHKHTISKPVISLEMAEGRCLSTDGLWFKSYIVRGEERPATDEEFKTMMDFLNENQVKVYDWIVNNFGLSKVFPVA